MAVKELYFGVGGFILGAVVMFIYYKAVAGKVAAVESTVAAVKKDV